MKGMLLLFCVVVLTTSIYAQNENEIDKSSAEGAVPVWREGMREWEKEFVKNSAEGAANSFYGFTFKPRKTEVENLKKNIDDWDWLKKYVDEGKAPLADFNFAGTTVRLTGLTKYAQKLAETCNNLRLKDLPRAKNQCNQAWRGYCSTNPTTIGDEYWEKLDKEIKTWEDSLNGEIKKKLSEYQALLVDLQKKMEDEEKQAAIKLAEEQQTREIERQEREARERKEKQAAQIAFEKNLTSLGCPPLKDFKKEYPPLDDSKWKGGLLSSGVFCCWTGKISQKVKDLYIVETHLKKFGFYAGKADLTKLKMGDNVAVYGAYQGKEKMATVIGVEEEVPTLKAYLVE